MLFITDLVLHFVTSIRNNDFWPNCHVLCSAGKWQPRFRDLIRKPVEFGVKETIVVD